MSKNHAISSEKQAVEASGIENPVMVTSTAIAGVVTTPIKQMVTKMHRIVDNGTQVLSTNLIIKHRIQWLTCLAQWLL